MSNARISRLLATLSIAAVTGLAPAALVAAETAVTVNNKPIPKAKLDAMLKQAAREGQKDSPELQAAAKEELIGRELLLQEVDKRGLGNSEEVKTALEAARLQILAAALVQDMTKKKPIKDDEIKAEYEQIKIGAGDKEYHPRHILLETEDQAKATIEQLKKGTKFEDLAKQSKDTGSASNGGDLGWTTPRAFVKEFGEALTKLGNGKFTDTPVKTQFGYHVIRLDETRPLKVPALEELKPRIVQSIQRRRLAQLQQELRAKAVIK